MSKKNNLISILIPVFNEQDNIKLLYYKICEEVAHHREFSFEILFINDGSSDSTQKNIDTLPKSNRNIIVRSIHHRKNLGKTIALSAGFNNCNGDIIITMDGDLQDDPMYLLGFIKRFQDEKKDLIVGNRVNKYKGDNINFVKKISSSLANKLSFILIGAPIHDINCGFKIMSKRCADTLVLKSDYHRYIPLIASIEGFDISEYDIEQKTRYSGDSKYGKSGLSRLVISFLDMLSISFVYKFRKEPFKLFGRLSLLLLIPGSGIMIYLTIRWLMGQYIYGRPMFFFGILFLILGFNLLTMGFLAELIVLTDRNKKQML